MARTSSSLPRFDEAVRKLDNSIKPQVKKLIAKILLNPHIGKPMQYGRKGTREVYAKPFRLSYRYDESRDHVELLDFYHKKHQ